MDLNFNIIMVHKLSAIVLVTSLAFSTILCAPSQQQQQASPLKAPSSQQVTSPTTTTSSALASSKSAFSSTTTVSPARSSSTSASNLASAASISSSSPSLVNFKNVANTESGNMDSIDTFDGKNPFADDSLWQIPVHLVRDLTDNDQDSHINNNRDNMAKSETRSAPLDENDDDDMDMVDNPAPSTLQANVPQSSSSSPTVISASTDLKTSAGYNHYNNHHYGGHYEPSHYHGKYFQYASVPDKYSWESGYRRGNPYHTIERYEHKDKHSYKAKVKWHDKHGYGVHLYDLNHIGHHDDHYGHQYSGHHGYGHHGNHHGYGH